MKEYFLFEIWMRRNVVLVRFDVPMDDSISVHVIDPGSNLSRDGISRLIFFSHTPASHLYTCSSVYSSVFNISVKWIVISPSFFGFD